jgi:hypothetical protein
MMKTSWMIMISLTSFLTMKMHVSKKISYPTLCLILINSSFFTNLPSRDPVFLDQFFDDKDFLSDDLLEDYFDSSFPMILNHVFPMTFYWSYMKISSKILCLSLCLL